MTKQEVINDIIYDLRMSGNAAFEADSESYEAFKLDNRGYAIKSNTRYFELLNIAAVRKEIAKLGKNILWL